MSWFIFAVLWRLKLKLGLQSSYTKASNNKTKTAACRVKYGRYDSAQKVNVKQSNQLGNVRNIL